MQPSAPVGQILSAIIARLDTGGEASPSAIGGIGEWALMLTSLLALLAAGGVAANQATWLKSKFTV